MFSKKTLTLQGSSKEENASMLRHQMLKEIGKRWSLRVHLTYKPRLEYLEDRTLLDSNLFFPAVNYDVGPGPYNVAVGDFNNDKIPDVVTANYYSNTVSVLMGNGDGTFQNAVQYAANSGPIYVVTGDFNRDGNLDLAVANDYSNTVSILLGNGDGTFRPPVSYRAGSRPIALAVGDFNGDGFLDLAVANTGSYDVSVLLGNGDGTFRPPVNYATGVFARDVVVGDFNNDGHLDLAVANQGSNTVSVLLGNGDGTFQPSVNYATGSDPTAINMGDFNGDGNIDLVTANFTFGGGDTSTVSVLLGNGDGTFQAPQNYQVGSHAHSVAVGDFDADGISDLAVASSVSDEVSVLLGNGDGTFAKAVNFSVGRLPHSVAVGDFNGDQFPDLAVANTDSNNVSILLNTGHIFGPMRASSDLVLNTNSTSKRESPSDLIVTQILPRSTVPQIPVSQENKENSFSQDPGFERIDGINVVAYQQLWNDVLLDEDSQVVGPGDQGIYPDVCEPIGSRHCYVPFAAEVFAKVTEW
jgi:hypothetical protein